jgi:hypothetical protein
MGLVTTLSINDIQQNINECHYAECRNAECGYAECCYYEESVVDKFKSNLLLMIFWLHIINYNS